MLYVFAYGPPVSGAVFQAARSILLETVQQAEQQDELRVLLPLLNSTVVPAKFNLVHGLRQGKEINMLVQPRSHVYPYQSPENPGIQQED